MANNDNSGDDMKDESDNKREQNPSQSDNPGNFANDREKAREAGRKGGQN